MEQEYSLAGDCSQFGIGGSQNAVEDPAISFELRWGYLLGLVVPYLRYPSIGSRPLCMLSRIW
jgi:hypothetical protein